MSRKRPYQIKITDRRTSRYIQTHGLREEFPEASDNELMRIAANRICNEEVAKLAFIGGSNEKAD